MTDMTDHMRATVNHRPNRRHGFDLGACDRR